MALERIRPHLDWIDSQFHHMVHMTESWSRINSGSYHVEGLARMIEALENHFSWLNPTSMERIDLAPLEAINARGEVEHLPLGQALRIRQRPDAPLQIMLGGHMDTVFSKDHPFQTPVYMDDCVEGGRMNGPGVADLKGGLVVMLKALEALERSEFKDRIGYEIIINPDEEIGSQSSDFLFEQVAKTARLGLIYEPALSDGTLAGARKGSGNFTCVVRGKAAHAGREFDKGRNAIVSASALVASLAALNGQREGVTLNIGRMEGGGALNMVPDLAIVRFNVRMEDAASRDWLASEIECITSQHPDPVFVHGGFTRAPKPMSRENEAVFEAVRRCGELLDQPIQWQATGGCCDGNNLWAYGLPNVDTLGVRGGKIHSDEEFVILDSIPERAKLSALLLIMLASGDITLPE